MATLGGRIVVAVFVVVSLISSASIGSDAKSASTYVAPSSRLVAWGANGFGQLGTGGLTGKPCYCHAFLNKVGLRHLVNIAAGDGFSVALTSSGQVYTWGRDELGQLGIGPIKHQCRCSPGPKRVAGLPLIAAISAGDSHVLALDRAGHIWDWGADFLGQLGLNQVCRVNTSGCIYPKHGCNCRYVPHRVQRIPPMRAIAAGYQYSLAIDRSGRIWGWGSNLYGQTAYGAYSEEFCGCVFFPTRSDFPRVVSIAAGTGFSLAITDRGSVIAWGLNDADELGSEKRQLSPMCLCIPTPVRVRLPQEARQISAGNGFALAILKGGHVFDWGKAAHGTLGRGQTRRPFSTVGRVPIDTRTRSIAAGYSDAFAITAGGALLGWGSVDRGSLAGLRPTDAACACRWAPTTLLQHAHRVSAGYGHALAITTTGQ